MRIDAKDLNERIDPLELLEHIGYEKSQPKVSGDEIRDFCPIHRGDTQKSLAISIGKHCFHCHKCGENGTLIDLYMKSRGVTDLPTAINELASRFACALLPNSYQNERPNPPQKERFVSANTDLLSLEVLDDSPNPIAVAKWDEASEEGQHEYFDKKKIAPCPGIRYGNDKHNNWSVIVPFYSIEGKLQAIQYVNNGGKFFLSGTHKKGNFFTLGNIEDGKKVYFAEGLATAITVRESLGKEFAVVSAGDAGNIPEVVGKIRGKYPKIEIVLALDNDEAGMKVKDKVEAPFSYCTPSFEGLSIPEGQKANDFNDLVSVCGQSLEHVRGQIQNKEKDSFFEKLGSIIDDQDFASKQKDRNYTTFEMEHKKLFAGGGLVSGFPGVDERLIFSKGDFVTVQAMSNHGKSTFMLQLAYKFATIAENTSKNPMCIYITYESSPIRVEEKLINIISHDCEGRTALQYDRKMEEKYLYPDYKDFPKTITTYNSLKANRKIEILIRTPLEKLGEIVDLYKKAFPDRMLVLIVDYLQIIDTNLDSDGWERIKAISRHLEALAIKKEILLVTAAQVNDRRQTREGRDLYNSSTTVIDILNHSHEALRANQDTVVHYREKVDGEAVCSISSFKQKHGETFELKEQFSFNGFRFKEKTAYNERKPIETAQQMKNRK